MDHLKQITKLSDAEIAIENPYRELAIMKRKKITTLRSGLQANATHWDTGEITQHGVAFTSAETVDTEQFVKIFLQGMNAYELLKATGRKVFTLLFMQIRENANEHKVLLSRTAAKKHRLNITESDFKRGIIQLIATNFIARTEEPNIFWINPEHMFNGSRITFVKRYALTEKVKVPEKPKQIDLKANDPAQGEIEAAIKAAQQEDRR